MECDCAPEMAKYKDSPCLGARVCCSTARPGRPSLIKLDACPLLRVVGLFLFVHLLLATLFLRIVDVVRFLTV